MTQPTQPNPSRDAHRDQARARPACTRPSVGPGRVGFGSVGSGRVRFGRGETWEGRTRVSRVTPSPRHDPRTRVLPTAYHDLRLEQILKHLVVPTSIANHKSTKSRFFVIAEKWSGVDTLDSQPALSASRWRKRTPCAPRRPWLVADESDQRNSPQFASGDHRRFSQTGLLNSLQLPVKPSAPPSHEHWDWVYLRR